MRAAAPAATSASSTGMTIMDQILAGVGLTRKSEEPPLRIYSRDTGVLLELRFGGDRVLMEEWAHAINVRLFPEQLWEKVRRWEALNRGAAEAASSTSLV